MVTDWVEPLDGCNFGSGNCCDGRDAGTRSAPLHVHRTRATKSNSATEFCSREPQLVADHPEQRRVIGTLYGHRLAVEIECRHDGLTPLLAFCHRDAADSRRMAETFFSRSLQGGNFVRVLRR